MHSKLLDQSPPCPRAINDAWLRQSTSAPAPIAPNATAELEAAIADVPALLQQSMKQLNAPSASLVAIQNGAVLFEQFAGTARLHQQVPPRIEAQSTHPHPENSSPD